MSVCYWSIEGIGIPMSEVFPHLNNAKVIDFLANELPEDINLNMWKNADNPEEFDIDCYLYGMPFDNLAEMLTHCDNTDTLTFGETENDCFLYYRPSMPWDHVQNEPKSANEVHRRIVKAVQALTDLSEEEIESLIVDDLFEVGCG